MPFKFGRLSEVFLKFASEVEVDPLYTSSVHGPQMEGLVQPLHEIPKAALCQNHVPRKDSHAVDPEMRRTGAELEGAWMTRQ